MCQVQDVRDALQALTKLRRMTTHMVAIVAPVLLGLSALRELDISYARFKGRDHHELYATFPALSKLTCLTMGHVRHVYQGSILGKWVSMPSREYCPNPTAATHA
jgi:hypothetical protein